VHWRKKYFKTFYRSLASHRERNDFSNNENFRLHNRHGMRDNPLNCVPVDRSQQMFNVECHNKLLYHNQYIKTNLTSLHRDPEY